jgi:hypothetical protein
VTFDFRDQPRLLDVLKLMAAKQKTTQKAIVIDELTAYFSQKQENLALLLASDQTFADWDNKDDKIYDSL